MINLRYFCFVVIQLYLKVRALALFYFINLHHYTYITVWFLEHTSEMPNLGPVRCIVTLVSVGDTSGLRFQCPSRCTWVQIYLEYTSGWADIDYFRCISFFRHYLIHRDSIIHGHSDVSQFKVHRDSIIHGRSDVSPVSMVNPMRLL